MATLVGKREWREPLVQKLIDRHGGQSPQQIVEAHAEKLRQRAGQDKLPIKVDLVASVAGVKRRVAPFDFAGRIYAEPNGQLVMDLNEDDNVARQRFTAAHELMHPAFPGFKEETRYRFDAAPAGTSSQNREEEWLCDYGAAALLMPVALVSGRYVAKESLSAVERLARDAEVSLEAAANRIVALSDEPVVFLCLGTSHKPADRPALRKGEHVAQRLRVRYATTAHIKLYVPRFKGAEDGSVFCRAISSGRGESGIEELPGAEGDGLFRIEAKRYGSGALERVLAIARPTA